MFLFVDCSVDVKINWIRLQVIKDVVAVVLSIAEQAREKFLPLHGAAALKKCT